MSTPRRVLVLVGGGHAHIQVVLGLSSTVTSSTACVLISDAELAVYSGMLPGVVAGLVAEGRAHVHLRALAAHKGLRFLHAAVTGIDSTRHELRFRPCAVPDAPECRMHFDFLSINVGSRTVAIPDLLLSPTVQGGAEKRLDPEFAPVVIQTRPILELMSSVQRFEESVQAHSVPVMVTNVVVVGGGAAGIELALALDTRFTKSLGKVKVTLVSREEAFAKAFGRQAGNAVVAELKKRKISFIFGTTAVAINRRSGLLILDRAPNLHFHLLVVATGAAPHAWLKDATDLQVDQDGWLLVEPTLLCKGHINIFAAGDCVSFGGRFGNGSPPKAGVYAVREGPILTQNLEMVLQHPSPLNFSLKRFAPQSSFLSLLSVGDGRGIGSKYGLVFKGTWVYRLKSFIDESWQDKFRVSPSNKRSPEMGGLLPKKEETFDGTPAEGAAILQAAEDILTGDSFEQQLLVLRRMDVDHDFRDSLLQHVRKDL